MRLAVGAQRIRHQRGAGHHRDDFGTLVVQHAQRVALDPAAGVLVRQRQTAQEIPQLLGVLGPALRIAEARQQQFDPLQPDSSESMRAKGDDLRVQRRIVDPERLDIYLLELAKTPRLRLLVAKHRARVPDLQRQLTLPEPVLGDGPHDARGGLRTQRQRPVALVAEGVHLLRDDIGRFPHPTLEKGGVLEDRRLDVAITGEPGGLEQGAADLEPARGIEPEERRRCLWARRKTGLTTNRR